MVDIAIDAIVGRGYKPTYIWDAPHCSRQWGEVNPCELRVNPGGSISLAPHKVIRFQFVMAIERSVTVGPHSLLVQVLDENHCDGNPF